MVCEGKRVPGLAGDVFLVSELAGECILRPDGVDVVLQLGSQPGVHLVGGRHTLVRVPTCPPATEISTYFCAKTYQHPAGDRQA